MTPSNGGVVLSKDKDMTHKFLRLFVDGKWTGNEDRSVTINGEVHNIDEYAKEHGIELPDSKSKKPKDIKKEVNIHADMGKQDHSGDHKVDGKRDSEGSE